MLTGDHPLLEKAYSPMSVRFLMLQTHYSSEIDLSNKGLLDAEKAYRKLMNAMDHLESLHFVDGNQEKDKEDQILALCQSCTDHMNDDFNTPRTIASLFGMAAHINTFNDNAMKVTGISAATFELLKSTYRIFIMDVLGLKEENQQDGTILDEVMEVIINIRNTAKTNKDWGTSDQIRDALKDAGVILKDNKEGITTYEVE